MPRKRRPNIIEFVTDTQFLGLSISEAQETLLRTIYGLPLSKTQLALFRECTGRDAPPSHGFSEVTVLAGARGGKDSRIAAPIACFEAVFGGHEKRLTRGERAVIPIVAQDHRATKIAFGYVRSYMTGSALLRSMVETELAQEIRLTNRVELVCFPSTMASLRGWSVPAGVLDEVAFFRLEGAADSDVEIQASIRRGMLSFAHPRLVKISTPFMKSGVLWDDFKAAWGQDDPDRLVWRASSVLMNPTLREERLERERRLDPLRFAREYEAVFAEDLEAFLPDAWVDAAVVADRHALPPAPGVRYVAAVDPSGGGADAFTLSICHTEGEGYTARVVQDVLKGYSRRGGEVNLEAIVNEYAATLREYGVNTVTGDRYAGNWVREAFKREDIHYADAERTKAEAYLEAQPLFAQGRIELLDHPRQTRELKLLEARPRAGGKTIVDHPRGGHDDYANALVLAALAAVTRPSASIPPKSMLMRLWHRPVMYDIRSRDDFASS